MRYGVCTGLENASALKAAGFDYIELAVAGDLKPMESADPTPGINQQLQKAGIPCESMNLLFSGNIKVTGPDASQERLASYMQTVGERAEKVGVKTIVFGGGGARKVPDGFPMEKAEEQILWFLKKTGDILATHKITLALEPLNRGETNIIHLVSEGADYVRKAAHPAVKLLADAYHMALEKEPWTVLTAVGDLLVHTHLAEDKERKAPGVKEYDYRPFLGNLKAAGYQGRVSIEAGWDNLTEQAPKALTVLRAAEKAGL
jgi:sugar phosphate isomerase/epimerase